MTLEDAFLRDILKQPDDDTTRLVYADWLEEQGDPRAEFLRLECRLRGLPEVGPEGRGVRRRLAFLTGPLDVRWLSAVCRVHLETGRPHEHPRRNPLNVPGPFYTCGDCM